MRAIAWTVAAACAWLVGACFNAPGGAVLFSCSEDAPDCPAGYTCKPDGCCHDEDESDAEYEDSKDQCSLAPPPTTGASSTAGSSTAGTADGTATTGPTGPSTTTDTSSTAATSSGSSDGGATSSTTSSTTAATGSSGGSSGSSDAGASSSSGTMGAG